MQQVAKRKTGHKKLKISLGILALLIAGFFVYKYVYIYTERRKYDQATVAINKVADDLRSQGINTEFSKGCEYENAESKTGALACSTGINYKANTISKDPVAAFNVFASDIGSVNKVGVETSDSTISFDQTKDFSQNIALQNTKLSCALYYTDHSQGDYWIGFSCGNPAKFVLF